MCTFLFILYTRIKASSAFSFRNILRRVSDDTASACIQITDRLRITIMVLLRRRIFFMLQRSNASCSTRWNRCRRGWRSFIQRNNYTFHHYYGAVFWGRWDRRRSFSCMHVQWRAVPPINIPTSFEVQWWESNISILHSLLSGAYK